jgi:CTP:molybdopterin cytidylyltransferase MocA
MKFGFLNEFSLLFRNNLKYCKSFFNYLFMLYDFSLVILAAGRSERMGISKHKLIYSGEKTFLDNIIDNYNRMKCSQIALVINDKVGNLLSDSAKSLPENLKIIVNHYPDYGRFYSIQLGLRALDFIQRVFIVNVDSPFFDTQICSRMIGGLEHCNYLYPVYKNKGGHPVIIDEVVAKDIIAQNDNSLNFREFLKNYRKKTINVSDQRIFININTPEDYKSSFGEISGQMTKCYANLKKSKIISKRNF